MLLWWCVNACNCFFLRNSAQFPRASKKHQFSTKTIKTKTNSTFISWKCCFYAEFEGDCILTRGLTESVLFAPKPRAEGSSPSAPAKSKTVTERWPFLFWHWVKWFRLRGTRSVLRGAGLRWRPLHEVQKHRPSRQARPSPSAPAKTKRHLRVSFLFCC